MNHLKKILINYIIFKSLLSKNYEYRVPSLFKNQTPKISIFLPIYNKGKYLIKAIKSLTYQTLKEIEIIAINDGSTDDTLSILKKLAKKDIRIKIINNDRNYGTLYTRAMGILNCSGEYIMNLDADDKIINDNSLKLLKALLFL
jgi:glycosyltransferase involved in cell wall biosynthesis